MITLAQFPVLTDDLLHMPHVYAPFAPFNKDDSPRFGVYIPAGAIKAHISDVLPPPSKGLFRATTLKRPEIIGGDVDWRVHELQRLDARNVGRDRIFFLERLFANVSINPADPATKAWLTERLGKRDWHVLYLNSVSYRELKE